MHQSPGTPTPPPPGDEPRRADLDAVSAVPLHPSAREVLLAALEQGWADPRRLHHEGRRARVLLDNAREVVADTLSLRPDEVTFTASGTEAVHRGLLGLALGRRRHGDLVLHSAVEHSSVLHALRWREAVHPGAGHEELPVTRTGQVATQTLRAAVHAHEGRVAAVAVQSANHEVGTRQDLVALAEVTGDVPLFTDACASLGHEDVPPVWAVAAGSAHKWGGPAGVGLLLVRKGARWRPPFPVDDRGDERAVGFENVPAALAAAAALRAAREDEGVTDRQRRLVARVRERVALLPDVDVVGDPDQRLPHVLTFSCLYLDGESLVSELDRRGFGIASGSACTSSTLQPSHVLAAMGALTHGNVRLSLHRDTTEQDVEGFLGVLPEVVAELRGRVGL